jgi:hypothetical protein
LASRILLARLSARNLLALIVHVHDGFSAAVWQTFFRDAQKKFIPAADGELWSV